ncbi:MAG: methyltransferase domain-containing protein [Pseudanabaena sp.]
MNPQFLQFLYCPKTHQSLSLEIESVDPLGMVITGKLSTNDGISYPIIRGIPRFVDTEYYASSFGFEWNRWPKVQFESENVGKPMAGHTSSMWKRITNATPENIKEKLIVEFGCGSGRFLDVIRQHGGIAIGIDLSQAVESARLNFANDPNVLIVQGDITNPPFRQGVFDGVYTIGALHHTPKPLEGLNAWVKTVKSDEWVAC